MDQEQKLIIALYVMVMMILFLIWFHIPRRYNIIDNKYEIKRSGFWYYVITYGEKRKKQYFWNYTDCITYIDGMKKEDE